MIVDTSVMRGADFLGYLNKSVAGAVDVTLSPAEASNAGLTFSGAITANIIVNFPLGSLSGRLYCFENTTSGAFTVTVKGQVGTGLEIAQGTRRIVMWTGADFVPWTAAL